MDCSVKNKHISKQRNHLKIFSLFFILFCSILVTTGCFDNLIPTVLNGDTIYQTHPTKLRYTIRYGYTITCEGTGSYTHHYYCDTPGVLLGSVSNIHLLQDTDYVYTTLAENNVVFWNISSDISNIYTLGITADVIIESFLVSDLTGSQALTLTQIQEQYPFIYAQYTQQQASDDQIYIDPGNWQIRSIADQVYTQTQSNNSFLLAKQLFSWLKQNTEYKIHADKTEVQTCIETNTLRTGDCDDLSFLYISLCRSLGIPARFIRGYLVDDHSGVLSMGSHAWAEIFVGGSIGNQGWIPVECAGNAESDIEIHQNFGIEDVSHLRLFTDDGTNESIGFSLSSISWTYTENMNINAEPFLDVTNYSILQEQQLVITKEDSRRYQTET